MISMINNTKQFGNSGESLNKAYAYDPETNEGIEGIIEHAEERCEFSRGKQSNNSQNNHPKHIWQKLGGFIDNIISYFKPEDNSFDSGLIFGDKQKDYASSTENLDEKLQEEMTKFGETFDTEDLRQLLPIFKSYLDKKNGIYNKITQIEKENEGLNDHRKQENPEAINEVNKLYEIADNYEVMEDLLTEKIKVILEEKHNIKVKTSTFLNQNWTPEQLKILKMALERDKKYKGVVKGLEEQLNKSNKSLKRSRLQTLGITALSIPLLLTSYFIGNINTVREVPVEVVREVMVPVSTAEKPKLVLDGKMYDVLRDSCKNYVRLPQDLLFRSGEVKVNDKYMPSLEKAVGELDNKLIIVDGYTDATHLRGGSELHGLYGSNGGLSEERARNVAKPISKKNPGKVIAYKGRGADNPIVVAQGPKWGNEDYQASRRVELSGFNNRYKKLTKKSNYNIARDLAKEGYTILKGGRDITMRYMKGKRHYARR